MLLYTERKEILLDILNWIPELLYTELKSVEMDSLTRTSKQEITWSQEFFCSVPLFILLCDNVNIR